MPKTSVELEPDVRKLLDEHCIKTNDKIKDVVNVSLRKNLTDISNKELLIEIKKEINKV